MLRFDSILRVSEDPIAASGANVPTFGIAGAAYFLPERSRSLEDWAALVGERGHALLPSMAANGLARYRVCGPMTVLELAARAVRRLIESSALDVEYVDAILFCHTNSTSVLAAPASVPVELKRQFGLRRAVGFSISQQNCASIVCTLQLLRSLFWRNTGWRNVLVVSADKSFLESWRGLGTYAIQSDGSLALWIQRDHAHNSVHHIVTYTDSVYYQGAAKNELLGKRLATNYPMIAHSLIERVVRESGWSMSEVGAILPMNANLGALRRVIELLKIPADRVFTRNVGPVGHVFACDPFINFIDRFTARSEQSTDKAVLYFSSSSGTFASLAIAGVRGFAAQASKT